MANNQLAKQRMAEIQAQLPQEKEWWDKRKSNIQSTFMKELDEDEEKAKGADSRKASIVSNPAAQKSNSDDDAVLVEAGGPAADTVQNQTPGSAKKKKNKK